MATILTVRLSTGYKRTQAGCTASLSVPGTVTQTIATGQHSLTAVYSGDNNYSPAIATGSLTVLAPIYTTSVTLTPSSTTVEAGQFVTLNATVTSDVTVINGIVTFYDGQSILGHATISIRGTASLQTNLFSVGANSLTAAYMGFTPPSAAYGTGIFQPSTSAPTVITVSAYTTTTVLTASSSSFVAGTVLTMNATVSSSSIPYGGVTFFDGATPLGTAALDDSGNAAFSTVTLTSGQHTLSAAYAANDPFAGSTSVNVPITVNAATANLQIPHVFFTRNGANGSNGGMQLSVAVSAVSGHPTGTITLLRDDQIVATAPVSSTGQASFALTKNGSGVHSIYASYSGDSAFAPKASPLFLSTDYTSVPDFSLQRATMETALPVPLTEPITISVNGFNNWSGVVQLSCTSGLPSSYSCAFSPPIVAGSGQTVVTFLPTTSISSIAAGWLGLALIVPYYRRRRRLRSLISGVLALTICLGCGTTSSTGINSQSTVVTVQATSGGVVHSLQIMVR